MALICAAIRRDSVSFLKFSFLNHIQLFSCEISLVCLLKYPYSCFSSYFCFLVFVAALFVFMHSVLLLVAVFNLFLLFFNVVFNAGKSSFHVVRFQYFNLLLIFIVIIIIACNHYLLFKEFFTPVLADDF